MTCSCVLVSFATEIARELAVSLTELKRRRAVQPPHNREKNRQHVHQQRVHSIWLATGREYGYAVSIGSSCAGAEGVASVVALAEDGSRSLHMAARNGWAAGMGAGQRVALADLRHH